MLNYEQHTISGIKTEIKGHFHTSLAAFVNSIPAAEQCLSTARIGLHHCGHRPGTVLSSDRHWHAVLEHGVALRQSRAAVVSWSLSWITVKQLCHCLRERVWPMLNIPEQWFESLSYLAQNLLWFGLHRNEVLSEPHPGHFCDCNIGEFIF
mgnify:CR=1 FL=1